MDTLILIPAHNEEASLGQLLDKLRDEGVREWADILVVDDYSSDRTGVIARRHKVIIVRNIFNLGYGSALQLGYKYAVRRGYKYVIQLDADGQHDASNVTALRRSLMTPEADGRCPDIVIGSRFLPGSVSFYCSGVKKLAIHMFCGMIRMFTGERFTDPTSGLQGLSRPAFLFYSQYNQFNSRYPDANMIIQMVMEGFRVREIPSIMHPREVGVSMHSGLSKQLFYMLVMGVSILTVAIREKRVQRASHGRSGYENYASMVKTHARPDGLL